MHQVTYPNPCSKKKQIVLLQGPNLKPVLLDRDVVPTWPFVKRKTNDCFPPSDAPALAAASMKTRNAAYDIDDRAEQITIPAERGAQAAEGQVETRGIVSFF